MQRTPATNARYAGKVRVSADASRDNVASLAISFLDLFGSIPHAAGTYRCRIGFLSLGFHCRDLLLTLGLKEAGAPLLSRPLEVYPCP